MSEHHMSVAEMCDLVGWTISDLSREAGIAWPTAKSAHDGKEPAPRTKKDICSAFSRYFQRTVTQAEIKWKEG